MTERNVVREEFYVRHHHEFRTLAAVRAAVKDAMADEIVRLRRDNAALTAAIERVRALHTPEIAGDTCPSGCQGTDALIEVRVGEWEWPPCPTLRALEGTP